LEKCYISDTGISSLQDYLNDFFALVPTDKVLEITMDYLYNDKEVQEFFAYVQSEEFPTIHRFVEYLREYKDVSVFLYMNFKCQYERENICSVPTGG
jgi:hypothetical protein